MSLFLCLCEGFLRVMRIKDINDEEELKMTKFSVSTLALFALSTAVVSVPALAEEGARKGPHGGFFERMDRNEDGKVTLSETQSHAAARFDSMDLNMDGFLTKEELEEAHQARKQKMQEKRADKSEKPNKEGRPELTDEQKAEHHKKRSQRKEKMFERSDKDGDGKISREEFLAQGSQHFSKMDTNGDGVVTKEELGEKKKHSKKRKGQEGFDTGVRPSED